MVRVVLGLGSNLGNREENLSKAMKQFTFLKNLKISSSFENQALLPQNAPEAWNINYINLAVSGNTNLEPLKLLEKIKFIEKFLGRPTIYEKWSPRIIDIDILLFGTKQIKTAKLTVPHPELYNRDFTLIPTQEIELELLKLNYNLKR